MLEQQRKQTFQTGNGTPIKSNINFAELRLKETLILRLTYAWIVLFSITPEYLRITQNRLCTKIADRSTMRTRFFNTWN